MNREHRREAKVRQQWEQLAQELGIKLTERQVNYLVELVMSGECPAIPSAEHIRQYLGWPERKTEVEK